MNTFNNSADAAEYAIVFDWIEDNVQFTEYYEPQFYVVAKIMLFTSATARGKDEYEALNNLKEIMIHNHPMRHNIATEWLYKSLNLPTC